MSFEQISSTQENRFHKYQTSSFLTHGIEAAEDIYKGAIVKLNSEGKLENANAVDDIAIGVAYHTQKEGERLTVISSFCMIVVGNAAGSVINPGDLVYNSSTTEDNYEWTILPRATGNRAQGVCLNKGAAAMGGKLTVGILWSAASNFLT